MYSILWLVVFLLLLGIEIATLGLTTIWFAIGSLAAFIATLFKASLLVQMILFILVSIISLVLTRPIAKKYLDKGKVKTNVDEIIGKTAVITKENDEAGSFGEANLNGEIWMIKSLYNEIFKKDEIVEIVSVEGVKLIVKRRKEDVK